MGQIFVFSYICLISQYMCVCIYIYVFALLVGVSCRCRQVDSCSACLGRKTWVPRYKTHWFPSWLMAPILIHGHGELNAAISATKSCLLLALGSTRIVQQYLMASPSDFLGYPMASFVEKTLVEQNLPSIDLLSYPMVSHGVSWHPPSPANPWQLRLWTAPSSKASLWPSTPGRSKAGEGGTTCLPGARHPWVKNLKISSDYSESSDYIVNI